MPPTGIAPPRPMTRREHRASRTRSDAHPDPDVPGEHGRAGQHQESPELPPADVALLAPWRNDISLAATACFDGARARRAGALVVMSCLPHVFDDVELSTTSMDGRPAPSSTPSCVTCSPPKRNTFTGRSRRRRDALGRDERQRLARTDGRAHRALPDRRAVVAHVALHHLLERAPSSSGRRTGRRGRSWSRRCSAA